MHTLIVLNSLSKTIENDHTKVNRNRYYLHHWSSYNSLIMAYERTCIVDTRMVFFEKALSHKLNDASYVFCGDEMNGGMMFTDSGIGTKCQRGAFG